MIKLSVGEMYLIMNTLEHRQTECSEALKCCDGGIARLYSMNREQCGQIIDKLHNAIVNCDKRIAIE